MHMQPVFQGCEVVGGGVAAALFWDGLGYLAVLVRLTGWAKWV